MGIVDVKVVSFFVNTPTNGITKISRENYLRDDICCGIELCKQCEEEGQLLKTEIHPPVIPDCVVLTANIDLFTHSAVKDVIILQTVLDKIKRNSLVAYKKLMRLKDDPEKRFFLFYNMFHHATFCDMENMRGKKASETVALIRTSMWYKHHVGNVAEPVIISENVEVKGEAKVNCLKCISTSEFVEMFPASESLADILTITDYKAIAEEKKNTYPEHLSTSQINAGLKSGALYCGKLEIESHNLYEGSVICKIRGEDETVMILGRNDMNRGMDGDLVAVSLLNPEECTIKNMEDHPHDYDSDEEDDLQVLYTYSKNNKKNFRGKIVGIIKRAWGVYCGNLDSNYIVNNINSDSSKIQALYFFPCNKKIPKIRIGTRQASRLADKRIAVAIDSWPKDSKYPLGHYIKTIGQAGERQVEIDVLLMENNIDANPFFQKVLSCLPPEKENWTVKPHHLIGRQDFRNLSIFSIDPPGCTDIDDALHCVMLPDGNFEVGIHIADVSYFIKPYTPIDTEARNRSTTVYLMGERIDMIPPLLGSNLCSLKENVDRLTVSCILKLDQNANIIKRDFCRSVIRSRSSLTYEQAQAIMSSKSVSDNLIEIHKSLNYLNNLAMKLRSYRKEAGALNLASSEMTFELGEDSFVYSISPKESYATNSLIEEFMLLTNIQAAKKIHSTFKRYSLLRKHPVPPRSKFDILIKAVESLGHTIDVSSSKNLSDSLDSISKKVDPYVDKLIRMHVTRCTPQAIYFSSGSTKEEGYWHYGLALPIYTHFTSPIRRYSDIIVHRILLASLGQGDIDPVVEYPPEILNEICDEINKKYYQAKVASRVHANILSTRFFIKSVSVVEGYIVRVMSNCFSVMISDYNVEGLVTMKNKSPESRKNITFNIDEYTVTTNKNIVLKLFDKVTVKVDSKPGDEDDSRKSKIILSLVNPYIEEFSTKSDL